MLTGGTLDRQSINCNRPFSSAFFIGLFPIQENDPCECVSGGEGQLLLQNRPGRSRREREN